MARCTQSLSQNSKPLHDTIAVFGMVSCRRWQWTVARARKVQSFSSQPSVAPGISTCTPGTAIALKPGLRTVIALKPGR